MYGWKTSAIGTLQNLIGKVIFVCPGKAFPSYVLNSTHISTRNIIVQEAQCQSTFKWCIILVSKAP